MGFDLYGMRPKGSLPEKTKYDREQEAVNGIYLRMDSSWWHPLWSFICTEIDPKKEILTEQQQANGDYSDLYCVEDPISDAQCLKLSEKITSMLDSGYVKEFEEWLDDYRKSGPKEKCSFCNGLGVHKNDFVCPACYGAGKRNGAEHSYFSEDTVKVFNEFLKKCGGFRIQ